jgi:hypothetical protein
MSTTRVECQIRRLQKVPDAVPVSALLLGDREIADDDALPTGPMVERSPGVPSRLGGVCGLRHVATLQRLLARNDGGSFDGQ